MHQNHHFLMLILSFNFPRDDFVLVRFAKTLKSAIFFVQYRFGHRLDCKNVDLGFVGSVDLDLVLVQFRLVKWNLWRSDQNAEGEKGEGMMYKMVWPISK